MIKNSQNYMYYGSKIQSVNSSKYAFHNIDVFADFIYEDKVYTLTAQNGHSYIGNDFNAALNSVDFYTEYSDKKVQEVWSDKKKDEDFYAFLEDAFSELEDYAEQILESDELKEVESILLESENEDEEYCFGRESIITDYLKELKDGGLV